MPRPAHEPLAQMAQERLGCVAQALNDLQAYGVRVSAAHGALLTDYGFLIPAEDGTWAVRMKVYDPQMQPVGDPDDD